MLYFFKIEKRITLLKSTIIISLLLLLTACNEETTTQEETPLANTIEISEEQYFRVVSPKSCEQSEKNRFIYQVMHDSYLWASEVPELDYKDSDYNSSEKMLTTLKSPNDKFSFIIDAETIQNFFEEGKNNDMGIGLTVAKLDATNYALVVKFVYPNSPADKKGVKRGDVIKLVENLAITEESFDEVVNILETYPTIEFTFLEPSSGKLTKKSITKKSYDIQTILYSNTFVNSNQSKIVGYFVFQDFIQNANGEIDTLFKQFKRNGINELILDLRYNGGGAINVANHLASLIGGNNVAENIFNQTLLNETYNYYNEVSYFEKPLPNALNLDRVFVITTESTCSSSELVINSLKASANHMEIIQIGNTTCGKPYGYMGAGLFCDKALYAINMESKNGDNEGGYVNGIIPTCQAQDNYFKSFGDTQENSLAVALNYIQTNRCSTSSQSNKQEKVKLQSKLKLPQDGFKRIMNAY